MEPATKKIDNPAWQKPARGNEQNDSVKAPTNETIKTGGNSRTAEDDLDLDKQPYRDKQPNSQMQFNKKDLDHDLKDDPDEEGDEQSPDL